MWNFCLIILFMNRCVLDILYWTFVKFRPFWAIIDHFFQGGILRSCLPGHRWAVFHFSTSPLQMVGRTQMAWSQYILFFQVFGQMPTLWCLCLPICYPLRSDEMPPTAQHLVWGWSGENIFTKKYQTASTAAGLLPPSRTKLQSWKWKRGREVFWMAEGFFSKKNVKRQVSQIIQPTMKRRAAFHLPAKGVHHRNVSCATSSCRAVHKRMHKAHECDAVYYLHAKVSA